MAPDRTLRIFAGLLHAFGDSCFVGLIVFDQFFHALIGNIFFRGEALRIAGLACLIQIFQLGAGQYLIEAENSFAMLISAALHVPAFSRRCQSPVGDDAV